MSSGKVNAMDMAPAVFKQTVKSWEFYEMLLDFAQKTTLGILALPVALPVLGLSVFFPPFAILGALTFIYLMYSLIAWVYEVYLRKVDLGKFQPEGRGTAWAVVTGSTSGIGEAYAKELAARGFNILLVGRTETKLQRVQKEITAVVEDVTVDYAISNAAHKSETEVNRVLEKVQTACNGKLALLINNVGTAPDHPDLLEETDLQEIEDQIVVNCIYPAKLTRILMPALKNADKAAIINLSSYTTKINAPRLAIYSATKAFNLHFSMVHGEECRQHGIDVVAITPSFVSSNMTKTEADPYGFTTATEPYVQDTLNKIGLQQSMGYPTHYLQLFLIQYAPTSVMRLMQNVVLPASVEQRSMALGINAS
eukprot:Clim_evm34s235 gene=Clim_evmTU34s235